ARASMIGILGLLVPARADGLAAGLGRPPLAACATGIGIAVAVCGLALPPRTAALAIALSAASAVLVGWLAHRQIGGYTGDVLGAAEQLTECVVLTLASAVAG
ncbi:MAG: adenosylcobinamide-GDP ribazoletransferase, partial [Pseudomonadota bacterium]|nr:adenosylcobinamide-GDP ribazoletransferase [Pseudomonadota bacterium]